jgi:hypothetical protein
MFLAQSKLIPGMQAVGVADLNSEKGRSACIRVLFEESFIILIN